MIEFGRFRLNREGGGLLRQDSAGAWGPVPIGSRAIEVLGVLVERRGDLVSKNDLMRLVWPATVVEEHNLTVQISALRRILDEDQDEASCIQTVTGRGYRFLPAVTVVLPQSPPVIVSEPMHTFQTVVSPETETISDQAARYQVRFRSVLIVSLVLCGFGLSALATWHFGGERHPTAAPRLSIVVLPFANQSGDSREDYLADGITDDLTTDLSRIPQTFVIAGPSARAYRNRLADSRQIGRELGVRYLLAGSVRRIETVLRVDAQLISAETGAQLWSDRFDEPVATLALGQDAIIARLRDALGISLIDIENARVRQAPPTTPDAFDLILRARDIRNQSVNRQHRAEGMALYEQALQLDPSSALALQGIINLRLEEKAWRGWWNTSEEERRVDDLLTRLRVVAPNSEEYLAMHSFWLKTEDDSCQQTMVAAQRLIEIYPNNLRGYTSLGWCKTATGHAEEEIPLQEKLIRLNPRSSYLYAAYWRMGYAATRLGRDREATIWLERSLAENPEGSDEFLRNAYRELAAAAGNVGDDTKARAALAALQKVNPFDTVRSQYPETSSAILVEQVKHYQEGLRRAGMRDHADEDADFSVPTTSVLQDHALGYTPLTVPGATTIRTADLPRLIKEQNPTILDTLLRPRWNSIPGALGLRSAGVGGSMSDAVEDRLRRKMAELSGGDLSRPIVTLGWNSERLTGYNLALRLVGLGYTNVFWYRGGMEAWQVAGYPEAELQTVEW